MVQNLVGQGSFLGQEVASLRITLQSAVDQIATLHAKIGELESKLDAVVRDTSHDRERISTLEQNQREQEEEDWWTNTDLVNKEM